MSPDRSVALKEGGEPMPVGDYAHTAIPLSAVDFDALERRAWNADGLDYETSVALIERLRRAETALESIRATVAGHAAACSVQRGGSCDRLPGCLQDGR